MERIVIACCRPKPGKRDALRALMRTHVPRLRAEGLVTDRAPIAMEARDGTVLEVFGWKSQAAIDSAHTNPAVLAMWKEFDEVCEYVPAAFVPEIAGLFSQFTPLD
jgi:quinol monooxygenase YgiN